MTGDTVSAVRRLDNPATGLLVGLVVLAAQVAWFVRAAAGEVGTATTAVVGPMAAGLVLAVLLWRHGARWSAAWVVALSLVWAYLGAQLASFWPAYF